MYDSDYPTWDYGDDDEYEPDYEPEYEDYPNAEDEEDSDDDRSSLGPDERKPIVGEEGKTTVHILDGAHPALAEEAQINVKQEIKEEIRDGPSVLHPFISKLEPEETAASSFVPGPTASEPAVIKSGTGKRAPANSGVGPDVQAGKRVSDPDRSKIRNPISHTTFCRSCEATEPNHTKSHHTISLLDLLTVSTTMYASSNMYSLLSVGAEAA